jgi:hypothetical protein
MEILINYYIILNLNFEFYINTYQIIYNIT